MDRFMPRIQISLTRQWRSALLLLSVSGLSVMSLSACTLTPEPMTLVAENKQHCGNETGAGLDGDVLTIRAGSRPTPGYAVELLSQTRRSGHLQITYQIAEPPPGRMLAQMITSPCTHIALPSDWESLRVVNQQSGEIFDFEHP